MVGVACKARSAFNRSAAKNAGCARRGKDSAWQSLQTVISLRRERRPNAVLRASFPLHVQVVPESPTSDAERTAQCLQDEGSGREATLDSKVQACAASGAHNH